MALKASPFFPGGPPDEAAPLARYLPPLAEGAAAAWLERIAPPHAWLLDPLGASPALALEAAQAGYRVLVACNNPINAFLLETQALAPRLADFQAVLARLSAARRGEERLETHIQALYESTCERCSAPLTAQAFLWRRGEAAPYARQYRCPACGDEGERPLPAGLPAPLLPGSDALARSRALQRVAAPEDEHYPAATAALETYLPRSLYALTTLINKQEGLPLSPEQRRLLHALLLSVCDSAGTLWPVPGGRARPRQLGVPPQFRESNLWLALEEAVSAWTRRSAPVALTRWPDLPPPEGGICLFAGRARSLFPLPAAVTPQAVLTVFPRPAQAYWTLSVMWAGWLWGREASLPLHPLLSRRRFDWAWNATAMGAALGPAARALPEGAPAAAIVPEIGPGFLASLLAAGNASGLDLASLAVRADEETAQLLWRAAPPRAARERADLEPLLKEGLQAALEAAREPLPYVTAYGGALSVPAAAGDLAAPDALARVQAAAGRLFANRQLLRRFGGSQEEERSLWGWTAPFASFEPPLSDRVEMETVKFLARAPGSTLREIDAGVCAALPGLAVPPADLIRATVESYAEELPQQPGRWRLMAQEEAPRRRADLEEARAALRAVAAHIGFDCEGENPIVWRPRGFGPVYYFFLMASSVIGRYILVDPPAPVRQCVLVFPGSRARLLSFKLRRDPRLGEAVFGWRLLKLRQLRNLRDAPGLTAAGWDELLDADPPYFDEAVQMQLL